MKNLKNTFFFLALILTQPAAKASEVKLDDIQFAAISNMMTYSLKAPEGQVSNLQGFIPMTFDHCSVRIDRSQDDEIKVVMNKLQYTISRQTLLDTAQVATPDYVFLVDESNTLADGAIQIRSTTDKKIVWFAVFQLGGSRKLEECSIRI